MRIALASSSSPRRTSRATCVRSGTRSSAWIGSSQTVERARQESYGALQTQVKTLAERTGTLSNALRTPHVRGRWGEAQLRNVVEYAGMVEHCDYVSQATTTTDDGTAASRPCRPDPRGQARRDRRESPARGVPRRFRDVRRLGSASASRRPRTPGARAHREALGEGILAPVRSDARFCRDVPPGRVLSPSGTRARLRPSRSTPGLPT